MYDASEARARLAKSADVVGVKGSDMGILGRAFKAVTAKKENDGWEIEGIATTDDVDCDREVVLPDGLDWSTMNAYKVLYGDHSYGSRYAVGVLRWVSRSMSPNGWKLRARLLPETYSEEIGRTRMLAEAGVLGMSIGFMVRSRSEPTPEEARKYPGAESIVRGAEVFEVSFTTMPCNLACAGNSVYVDDSKSAGLYELVAKGRLDKRFAPPQPKARKTVIV